MKIGIDARTIESQITGVGRYLSNLLKFWKNDNDNEFNLYFKDKIPNIDFLESKNFKKTLIKNPFGFSSNFFFQHFLLPYNLKKDNVDFFFSPFYLKPFYCPVKSAIVLHDISYEAHPKWFDFKSQLILRMLSKYSAKTADLIFTVSNFSKEEIIKYYKIDKDKINVTYLGFDKSFVKAEPGIKKVMEFSVMPNNTIKEKYNLNEKFILCVGSIFNRRHISEIIVAFEKIAKKRVDYQLIIIGENRTYPFIDIDKKIKKVNENLGRKAIIHLNFVDEGELIAFYKSCKVNIYVSDYEGFGLPVIEAQFFGKPVITSYNSSLIEVGGYSVEFVKKNTVDEIYNSLEKIISNDNYSDKLVKLSFKNAERFNWKICAKKTLEKILWY